MSFLTSRGWCHGLLPLLLIFTMTDRPHLHVNEGLSVVEGDSGGGGGGNPQADACHGEVGDVAGSCQAIQRDR